MTRGKPRRLASGNVRRLAVAAVAGSLLLSACASGGGSGGSGGSGSSSSPASVQNGIIGNQNDEGSPVKGGTLSFAGYSSATSLDPTKTQPNGSTGGTEMAAIYDVLVRYDYASKKFVPQLAQSIEADSDSKVWTLKLREGVTFSDGSPLNAEAVVASIERFNNNRGATSQVWKTNVASMEASDPSTVVFTLKGTWREFPTLLGLGQGMIVAPAASKSEKFTPIGAGPFTLEKFAPHATTVLKARPDYWGGAPNLDELNFTEILGDQAKADALKSGGLQMAFTRTAQVVDQEKKTYPGFSVTNPLGAQLNINSRPGRPGADVRVRQAMAYAVSPDTFNQRVNGGKGDPGSEIFPSWSQWHNDVGGLKTDQAKAKQLVEAAKKDGFDGNIDYVGINSPAAQKTALTTQAALQAVGFTVKIDYVNGVADVVKKLYVDHDFDLAFASFSLLNSAPYINLYGGLDSESSNNALGYKNPDMDAALVKVKAAPTDEAKTAALAEVQKLFNDTVPIVTLGATTSFIPWQKSVHGVKVTPDGIVLFDKAWIKK